MPPTFPITLPHAALTVIEESYSHHPLLTPYYDVKIFLTCSKQVRRQRLSVKEGPRLPSFLRCWIPLEKQYFTVYSISNEKGRWLCHLPFSYFTGNTSSLQSSRQSSTAL